MTKPELSVIVPVINEAEHLPILLESLRCQQGIKLEVIVSDGGSTDGSASFATKAGARVVHGPAGRGRQMNAAADKAMGRFLLFLHADSVLKNSSLLADGVNFIQAQLNKQEDHRVAGHFPLRFIRTNGANIGLYRWLAEKSRLNRPNTTSGDQGLLLAREFFAELGGFDETYPFLEDQEMAERIRCSGRWVTLPGVLETSARRFEAEGFYRRYILMALMMACFMAGGNNFFVRAPSVYQAQCRTTRLALTPFLGAIWRMMGEDLGFAGSLGFWFRIGRYVRQNAWQPFFALDVLSGKSSRERTRCLAYYDRYVQRMLDFAVIDVITGFLTFVCFMMIIAPFFWVSELLSPKFNNKQTFI